MNARAIALSRPDYGAMEQRMMARALGDAGGNRYREAFETGFAQAVGRDYAVAVSNGTVGLWLALAACGLRARDEVILSPRAWRALGHALSHAGLRPVFADIDAESGCLNPHAVEQLIGPRTRAILAANSNGHPADWQALVPLARRHQLMLLEDSSEAIASRYLGREVGGFGDLALFDFALPCALCCGEGGMVVTDDPGLATRLYRLRDAQGGIARDCPRLRAPLHAPLAETCAALGLAQLERLDEMLAERKRVESAYRQRLAAIEGLCLPRLGADVDEVHWMVYAIELAPGLKPLLMTALDDADIGCAEFMPPGLSARPREPRAWPLCRASHARTLALPFHSRINDEDIERIARVLETGLTRVGDVSFVAGR